MAPVPLKCTASDCEFITPPNCPDWEKMLKLLELHTAAVHNVPTGQVGASPSTKLEKLPRPSFSLDMTQSEWAFKESQWQAYISQSTVSEKVKVQQLQAACEQDLLRRVHDAGGLDKLDTELLLLAQIKKLAVKVVHKTLHMQNLWNMTQSPEEPIRAFCSRLVGTAELCDFVLTCTEPNCGKQNSYRDKMVMQALLKGMHDTDIRTRVLSRTQNSELVTLLEITDYIAAEEASSASFSSLATPHTIAAGKSSYKKLLHHPEPLPPTTTCSHCGARHPGDSSPASRQLHCKAYGKKCSACEKSHHFAQVCKSKPKNREQVPSPPSHSPLTGAVLSDSARFYAMQTSAPSTYQHLVPYISALGTAGPVTTIPLPHVVHSIHDGWRRKQAKPSPTLPLDICVDRAAYSELRIPAPTTSLRSRKLRSQRSCADTGAQLFTIPTSMLSQLGVKQADLFPVATNLNTVTGAPVDIVGGLLLKLSGTNPKTGAVRTTRQLAYVSHTVPYPFLSREACQDLGLIPASFPAIGSCDTQTTATAAANTTATHTRCSNSGVTSPDEQPCSCPPRELPPTTPPSLPCAPTPNNLHILKDYILTRYAGSAFNTCEKQPLPLMQDSPPLKLFIDENAKPVAAHTPFPVPIHWQAQVKAGLDRDVRLGVLERVPVNEPTTWCARMLITPKHDGSPRRVIDYQAVNEHCPRQTHHTRSPWQIAASVPPNTVKTVLDAWHGYHSVPVHPADRHVTTFICQDGRYRYRTAPQGLLCAGDAYTQRADEIIGDFKGHVKCVDDSLLYTNDIESNFMATCAFIDKCSRGGIIFNPNKFQFGLETVNYLGFKVTKEGLQPTDEFLENIRSFPSPKSITDVRSWYGAINQVSYSFATSQIMLPFRQLLRPQVPFFWSEELEAAFVESKEEIIRQCEKGVRLFDMSAPTGLATDWSKSCMGFWLVQKHCKCPGEPKLACCKTGWQTVHCGSRFNSGPESRFHPIEGEAAAAVNGLEKTSMFTLGLPNLLLALDHKPLIKIFGNATLHGISNPRLFNFKQKSLKFRVKPVHVPGKQHVVPDTFSRRSDGPHNDEAISNVLPGYSESMAPPDWVSSPIIASTSHNDSMETEALIAGLAMSRLAGFNDPPESLHAHMSAPSIQAITWSMLEAACLSCPEYQLLHATIQAGVSHDSKDWDQKLLPYFKHRHLLTTTGPVVLISDRPVIPKSLRSRVIEHLHSGHPGLSTMCQRMAATLYWPDYKHDLTKAKLSCSTCRSIAPSNPAMPPSPPSVPTYPFQSVVCDFFFVSGKTYAAIADRYSNWLSIVALERDTSQELIKELRLYFSTFGIAEIFSSDGASIFTSAMFKEFCTRWGIQHRVSSAYHAHSNKRAEVAVKAAKRLVRDSLGPSGTLDTDALARAILAHRNTPDPTTGLSPAQVIFGRQVRDFTPCSPGRYHPREEWRLMAENRELAMSKRHIRSEETLTKGSKTLPPLLEGDHVSIQDQSGHTPKRWSKTGKVIECSGHDSYLIKVDGSQRLTKRNRQFLRKLQLYKADPDTPLLPLPIPVDSSDPEKSQDCPADPLDTQSQDDHDPDLDQQQTLGDRDPHQPDQEPQHVNPTPHQPPVDQPRWPRKPVREKWIVSDKFKRLPQPPQTQPPPASSCALPVPTGPPAQWPAHMPYDPPYLQPQVSPHHPGLHPEVMPQENQLYATLVRLEAVSRKQIEDSQQLQAYLAAILASQANHSLTVGGIPGYQPS